ncbi:hypothetical protein Pcinc_023824 [Petrolisthes cinctipes]|uniref:Fibronectin type-III domain-containing protein n=1 Tax=Petrolisthes cinctipes TaxID=88211 RepID=A0AAE1FC38_PETCI|nr:hypothetical protein Pcinc_023824 [Petrolisthes cinctipes]
MTFRGCLSVLLLCVVSVRSDVDDEEKVPGPPENLTMLRVHDRSVDLQWNQPTEPNGEIRGYRVYFIKGNITSVRTVHANDPSITFSLHDLGQYP